MRTKTLLAAAVLAAGLATSMAQSNVYSLNVVGYVNQVAPANGFTLIANPLNATNNTVAALIKGARSGTVLYKFNAGFQANSYSAGSGLWTDGSATLNPGEGAFLFVPAGIDYTNTWVGEVMQGSLTNPVVAGFSIVGSKVPQAGLVKTDLQFPAVSGTIVYKWNDPNPGFNANSYSAGSGTWAPSEPTIGVAQGFFSAQPAAVNWTRNFTVQ